MKTTKDMAVIAKAEGLAGALYLLEAYSGSMQASFRMESKTCSRYIHLYPAGYRVEAEFQQYANSGYEDAHDYDDLTFRGDIDAVKDFAKGYLRLFAKISCNVAAEILAEECQG